MAVTPNKFGPGTLILGPNDTPIADVSCQVQSLTIEWDNDEEDPINVLCGDSVSGGMSFTASMNGTFLQDLQNDEAAQGIVAYSWAHKGETVAFNFTPNNEIGTIVTGEVTLIPLTVGGEDYGTTMTSEFEWPCVGEPQLNFGAVPPETVEV